MKLENFYVHSRKIRLNPYCQILKMFPLGYNFSLRFLMWQTKGGNHKGLPPLEFSPFGKPLSLTPLLRLRWRKRRARAKLYADFNA